MEVVGIILMFGIFLEQIPYWLWVRRRVLAKTAKTLHTPEMGAPQPKAKAQDRVICAHARVSRAQEGRSTRARPKPARCGCRTPSRPIRCGWTSTLNRLQPGRPAYARTIRRSCRTFGARVCARR
jgi:hypothetical protein